MEIKKNNIVKSKLLKGSKVIRKYISVGIVSLVLLGCSVASKNDVATTQISLPEGVTLVESHPQNSDSVSIPFSKYTLDNGLTVVLHKDDSDPLVHVDVTYHVGSAREELGKSGFAHFFEHMMFQGSKHIADEEHFKIVTEAGGNMNGSTNSDRTNYYQTVPANQLEKVLWLEADRMGFLLDSVTQEKFEVQRETVKNERGQSYDNQPYGLRSERNSEVLYPVGHPYSWSTIGYVEDLDRVTVDDLKSFFQRWYGPNNAVITIGGDIDELKTLQWVQRYFGSIPAGPEVKDAPKKAVTLDKDQYVTLEDQVYLPLLQVTYPTVYVRHEDEAPLDVLSDILGGGKTSLFYKNLVKENFAVQAVVSHPCRELACEFQLIALANPDKSPRLADIQQKIAQTLAEFEQRGVNPDDLNRTKASIESSTIFGLQSVSGKVSTLASNQTFDGEPDKVQYDLDRYNSVTAEDVMRVFRQYIKDKHKVVLSIVPVGQTQLQAAAPTVGPLDRTFPIASVSQQVKAPVIEDTFDRNIQPKAGPNPTIKVPDFTRTKFTNGLEMLTHRSAETPTVTLLLSLEGGPLLDPIEKAGLAAFTADMMNESTLNKSNEELANELALLGSSISFSAGGRFTQVNVNSLVKNLDKTLALLQEKLLSPAFLQEDFDRIKQSLLQQLQQQIKNPSVLANRAVSTLLYGDENRISLPDSGTLETLQNIQLSDVKEFYARYYSPVMANLVVVGDIDESAFAKRIDFLRNWRGANYTIPSYNTFPQYSDSKIYLIDKPDAAQSVVKIIERGLPYDALGKHFKSKLMNFALGGNFNSRINQNLREDKGYTYGASSAFVGGKTLGRFQAGADLKKENTGDGITELLNEIEHYQQQGMTEPELLMMRSAFTQSEALNYETPYSKAAFLNHLLTYGLDKGYREKQAEMINSTSREALNELAKQLLDTNKMQIVVVGDASELMKQLQPLGREVVMMTVSQ